MSRSVISVICLFSLIFIGSYTVVAGGDPEGELCVPLGYLTLEPPDEDSARRSAVDFPHAVHFQYNCLTCHHKWDKTDELNGCMTSGCHDLEETPEKASADEAILFYKKAYHDLCIGCHKEIKAKNRAMAKSGNLGGRIAKAGPTGCVQCHPKE